MVLVFDTDVEKTDILQKNIDYLKKYASQVKVVNLAQVMNFEDEIARAADARKAQGLTKSLTEVSTANSHAIQAPPREKPTLPVLWHHM